MAKISIISDLHFGFGEEERKEDVFCAAEEAFRKAKERGSDIVVLAGDIFDSRFPKPEHWSRAMELLSVFQEGEGARVVSRSSDKKINGSAANGIPVVAIHGTHERRSEKLTNPIEGLEKAGFLFHLHCESLTLKNGDEKIVVHGMSGVPEKYSKKVLRRWDPSPKEDAYNIFMLHQDLEPYIYNPANPPELSLENLPTGFDCYISGHIHWRERTEIRDKPFLIPGSLVPTQLKKKEAEREKGFYFLNTENEEIEFVPVNDSREFVYKELEVEDSQPGEVRNELEAVLERTLGEKRETKPLVRIKITGELPKGVDSNELDLNSVTEAYLNRGIVTLRKDLTEKDVEDKVQMLRDLRQEEQSIDEIGMNLLRQELEEMETGLDSDLIFADLSEGRIEDALNKLIEKGEDEEGEEDEWWEEASNRSA